MDLIDTVCDKFLVLHSSFPLGISSSYFRIFVIDV